MNIFIRHTPPNFPLILSNLYEYARIALNLHTFHDMANSLFRHLLRLFVPLALVFMLASCSPAKRVQRRGGYLHVSNTVKTDRTGIKSDDLLNFAQPKPNKKFLGLIRPRVWFYDLFSRGRDTRVKRFLKKGLGQTPVLLDSTMVDNSLVPMTIYLNNKGYFGASVTREITLERAISKTRYYTHTPDPFLFGTVQYEIFDDSLRLFMEKIKQKALITPGKQYDAYLIRDERERITRELRDIGYYNFSREYIFFEVDTTSKPLQANITIRIEDVRSRGQVTADSIVYKRHKRFFISDIYINSNFIDVRGEAPAQNDTLAYHAKKDTATIVGPDFYQIYRQDLRLRPIVLWRSLYIHPGEPYSQKYINLTYNRLQNLGLSRFVSVNVNPLVMPDSTAADFGLLNFEIRMARAPVNMFTVEAEGTNSGDYVGLGSSVNYRNRNIFRGAETLRLKLRGAFEFTPSPVIESQGKTAFFNSLEAGIETGLDFPTLLAPFRINRLGINAKAKTTIALGLSYQQRPNYTRYLNYFSYGYEWNTSDITRHLFTPIELSSVSISRDSVFTTYLENLGDPRFLTQYTDHLIMAMKYSFIYNNQLFTKNSNYWFFRGNIESAGNALNLYSKIEKKPAADIDGNYTLFGIRYAQYLRTDVDLRYYKPTGFGQTVVYRVAFGIGLPYGNSSALPFEKGFFAGGANGMRGWPIRSLGPGEYHSTVKTDFERVGDLWFETNVEYRFPMYSFIDGGVFADAGNVWLLKQNDDFPLGNIMASHFLKSLAVDVGMGLRFDFSFFVFRIDGGIQIYDPGNLPGSRWYKPGKLKLKDINWNFGIGYPF